MRSPSRLSLVSALLAGAAISCGTALPEPTVPEPTRPPPPPTTAAPAAPIAPPYLPAQVLAKLDDENATPYFARRGDEGLVLYASHAHWYVRALGADGAPKGEARDVATMASDPAMAALKPVADGYLAVWAERVAKNHVIKALGLDAEGKPRGEAALVAQVTEDVTWVDVHPNKKGALVVWEIPRDERMDITVVPVSPAGKPEGAATLVAQGVIGWELEPTERGAVLATVASDASAPAPAKKGKRKPAKTADDARSGRLGKVLLTEIDDRGKASAPVVVSAEPTAELDVTIAEVSGKYIVAWTDERNIDACVYVAVAEPGGKISAAPHRATSPFGEQALVSVVAEPYAPGAPRSKRALLAWEDQLRAPREGRLIHLATIGPDGALGKERATLVFSASGPPDLEADGDGFAALTLAPVRDLPPGVTAQKQQGVQGDAPVWASFVRFGADLSVIASEPIRAEAFADADGVPYISRWLSCHGGKCSVIGQGVVTPAKGPDTPAVAAPLAAITLPTREGPWKAPAFREADEAPPRAVSVSALYDGDHLAKVTAAELPGGGTLAGWVTYVLESAGGGRGKRGKAAGEDGQAATLAVRPINAEGAPGKTVAISNKAVSIGGIAMAPAPAKDGKKPETALGWVTRVRGEPQVFLTKLGPDGEKLAEKGVTVISRKKKGMPTTEASDVAVAYNPENDGWITAWVDTRDGNAEIYVAKVDRSLTKVVPDKRVTEAPGDSAEVQIAVRGKDVLLVWSDARAKPDEGSGDIYVARLDAQTLKKTGPEIRLFASATHSRTPQIVPTAKGYLVAWIEEGEAGKNGDQGAGVRIAELDEKGMVIGAPQLVRAVDGQGTVTSATLGCGQKSCRGVLTSAVGDALLLGAFEVQPGATAGAVKTIAALTGGANQDVSPAFSGANATSLFFADDAVGGTGRVRWMTIAWP